MQRHISKTYKSYFPASLIYITILKLFVSDHLSIHVLKKSDHKKECKHRTNKQKKRQLQKQGLTVIMTMILPKENIIKDHKVHYFKQLMDIHLKNGEWTNLKANQYTPKQTASMN